MWRDIFGGRIVPAGREFDAFFDAEVADCRLDPDDPDIVALRVELRSGLIRSIKGDGEFAAGWLETLAGVYSARWRQRAVKMPFDLPPDLAERAAAELARRRELIRQIDAKIADPAVGDRAEASEIFDAAIDLKATHAKGIDTVERLVAAHDGYRDQAREAIDILDETVTETLKAFERPRRIAVATVAAIGLVAATGYELLTNDRGVQWVVIVCGFLAGAVVDKIARVAVVRGSLSPHIEGSVQLLAKADLVVRWVDRGQAKAADDLRQAIDLMSQPPSTGAA